MRSCSIISGIIAAASTASAFAQVPYANNFTTGTPGPEWSTTQTEVSPNGERFLGQFNPGTVTLNLGNQPAGTYTLSFDFYAIQSLDGNGPAGGGTDNFQFAYDGGINLFTTNFDNYGGGGNTQAYPNQVAPFGPGGAFAAGTGAVATNSLGYTFGGAAFGDSTYHFSFSVAHAAGPLSFAFIGMENQPVGDEGWGIDNVSVVPAPAGVGLLGLAGLGAAGRRRRTR